MLDENTEIVDKLPEHLKNLLEKCLFYVLMEFVSHLKLFSYSDKIHNSKYELNICSQFIICSVRVYDSAFNVRKAWNRQR